MNIDILDASTLGDDLDFTIFNKFGNVNVYDMTSDEQILKRIEQSDILIINKIKLNKANLCVCKNLKLICIAATGFDNVDIDYCKSKNIAVCNVVGYSTHSVAQLTVSMVLSLINHLPEYDKSVKNMTYTYGGIQNILKPIYHEISGKTWGIVGFGNIGGQVANIAKAFGCKVIVYKRNKISDYECVTLDELMKNSDIITIHLPLTPYTNNIIDKNMISLMKKNAVVVNVSRGAVWDEFAIADALKNGDIAGFGCDVYSVEPIQENHPFIEILNYENVCLTPHMAWGSYESRVRCMSEIAKNIEMFISGSIHNRLDI